MNKYAEEAQKQTNKASLSLIKGDLSTAEHQLNRALAHIRQAKQEIEQQE